MHLPPTSVYPGRHAHLPLRQPQLLALHWALFVHVPPSAIYDAIPDDTEPNQSVSSELRLYWHYFGTSSEYSASPFLPLSETCQLKQNSTIDSIHH